MDNNNTNNFVADLQQQLINLRYMMVIRTCNEECWQMEVSINKTQISWLISLQ